MNRSTKSKLNDSRLPERFWRLITVDEAGCWVWGGSRTAGGYGRYQYQLSKAYVHHWTGGKPPEGLVTDHLCRNRACCNPAHLEFVSPRTNVLRGEGLPAGRAKKTHCLRGHSLTDSNAYHYKGHRFCKICSRERTRKRWNENPAVREANRLRSAAWYKEKKKK